MTQARTPDSSTSPTTHTATLISGHHLIARTPEELASARRKLHPQVPERSWLLSEAPETLHTVLTDLDITEFPVLLHLASRSSLSLDYTHEREIAQWLRHNAAH